MPTIEHLGSVVPSKRLAAIEKIIRDFHVAMDQRRNATTAAHVAIDAIEEVLGLRWESQSLRRYQSTEQERDMTDFVQYRRKQIAELRPYSPGEALDGVSISAPDKEAGSPKVGDMIARNPKNHADQWLVAAQYFADNFEAA